MLRFDLITLFPRMAEGFLQESMLGQAAKNELLEIGVHDLRDWSQNKHQTADDRPFGGGPGMVLSPEPLFLSIEEVSTPGAEVIFLCPDGEPLSTPMARELAQKEHIVLVSGHYEGIDQRVRDHLVTREVSIGDYVLTNGTLPACVLIDCVARYVPGVLGEEKSLTQDSFSGTFLGFPQFTRPADYRGMKVPEVLLSGNHAAIEAWRQEQSLLKTQQRRPDLLERAAKAAPPDEKSPH
ncbi:MAG: tRNA (guanosine(37)-N1)-methyltransferase TrmD [Verrucomicrobiota bacterium]